LVGGLIKLTISAQDAARLLQAGFLESEVSAIAEAKTAKGEDQSPVDLNSPIWQSVMESRREWWLDKIDRGWTEHEIVSELENYYKRDKSRNPFDFLKAEYKSRKRADYIEITRKRHAAQIAGELEGYKL